jgi:MFS transporter, ACS family, D-galactonate transporter
MALALLVLSVFLNYIDRSNLSIALPYLKDELGLSPSRLGILLSAFFWTYSTFQLAAGWLVDRIHVGWVLTAGFLLWSVATGVTGFQHTFTGLLIVRTVLGMGESVAYPAYSKILAQLFPEARRGFANSLVAAGAAAGPGLGLIVAGTFMARFGWRSFFVILGFFSLLWLIPWIVWMPAANQKTSSQSQPLLPVGILDILLQRSAWGTFAGLFCINYVFYFLITWLPYYLVRDRNLPTAAMVLVAGSAYLLNSFTATLCGWLSDRWLAGGATPTRVRKTFLSVGVAGAGLFLVLCAFAPIRPAILLLLLGSAFLGICNSNIWAVTQTLAGPHVVGRWAGVQNFLGNFSGIAAPALTGFLIDRTQHFFSAFAVMALVALAGALSWIFLVGRVEPVDWAVPPPDSAFH